MKSLFKRLILWAGAPETEEPTSIPLWKPEVDTASYQAPEPCEELIVTPSQTERLSKIINGKTVAAKTVFERLVLSTYKLNTKAFYKYYINAEEEQFRALRIAEDEEGGGVVFLREKNEEFFYVDFVKNGDTKEPRSSNCGLDFSVLVETYLENLDTEDPKIIALSEAMDNLNIYPPKAGE